MPRLLAPFFALLYSLPYLALLGCGVRSIAGLAGRERGRIVLVCVTALCLAALYAVCIHRNPWASNALFYHKDDASYDRWGQRIAANWHEGNFPRLSSDRQIGSLHMGYYRLVAAVYFAAGHRPLLVIGLNLLACAMLPLALYVLTARLWGEKAGWTGAWLGALYPTFWFHSAFLLRDVWITLFFLAAEIAVLHVVGQAGGRGGGATGKRESLRVFCLMTFLFQLFLLRFYLALTVMAAWALYELALGARKKRAWMLAGVAAAVFVMARFHPSIAHFQDRMVQSFTWSIPRSLDTLGEVGQRFVASAGKLFLAPLAWATRGGYTVDYFLWPGQWMMYLLLLPFGIWGIYRAIRTGPPAVFVLILPLIVAAYGFAVAYEGSVPRQRMFLDALLIVFAARAWSPGADRPARLYLRVYYVLFAAFVLIHIGSLFVRRIW